MKTQKLDNFHDGTTYKLFMECLCGCGELTRNLFRQGHDMKLAVQKDKGR